MGNENTLKIDLEQPMPNYYTQISAFDAYNTALQATASNIANVNTNAYKSQRVVLESGPDDVGVRVASVFRDYSPGPAVITNFSEVAARSAQGQMAQAHRNAEAENTVIQGTAMASERRSAGTNSIMEQEMRGYENAMRAEALGYTEGSNVNLPTEFVNLIHTEMAYSANASVIRTQEVLAGALINAIA